MSPRYATPECAPFRLETGGTECCLCVHGFTGCPALYLPLSETLRDGGFGVEAPLLAGHGTRPEDLSAVDEADWFRGTASVLERLFERYAKVHLIGLSLGGAIAAWLASNYADEGRLGKLALLSPGFGLRDKRFYAMDLDAAEDRMLPLPRRPLKDDGLDASRYGYPAMSLKGVRQLILATERSVASLGAIRAPTMLLYTSADAIADPEDCERAIAAIPTIARSHRYEGGEHNLLLGPDRLDVIARITAFLGDGA